MSRLLTIGGFAALACTLVVISFVGRTDRTDRENMVRERGRVPAENRTPAPAAPEGTWTGLLVDAGCRDRARAGLPVARQQTRGSADRSDPRAADALEHLVPDVATRQDDTSCSVTGATRAFALYLPDGSFQTLDEAGNTKALAAFQANPQGQAVLNGRAPGAKPRVMVKGRLTPERLVVETLEIVP